jgi:beta-N-acetylhexosaminidase
LRKRTGAGGTTCNDDLTGEPSSVDHDDNDKLHEDDQFHDHSARATSLTNVHRWLSLPILGLIVACAGSRDATDPPPASATEVVVSTVPAPPGTSTTSSPAPPEPSAQAATTATPVIVETTVACAPPIGLEQQIALLVWPSVYSSDWETARSVVRDHGLGGVLLMKPAGWDADTITLRLGELESESPFGLVVATDEEGGDVQRLTGVSSLDSQFDISTQMPPDDAFQVISQHAEIAAGIGIDVVFAPVVDVLPSEGSPPLRRSRFFAGGPERVSAYAAAYVDAWQRAGVLPVLKHFPGHGEASGDTHVGDGVTAPLPELERRDLVPYRMLSGTGTGVMVGHLTTPELSDGLPASRSAHAIDYLRDELGYQDALVVSDSLDMGAVGVPVPQAAAESLDAGVDVVLFTDPSITGSVIESITAAVVDGAIPTERIEDAALKVWRLLGHEGDPC